VFAVKGGAQAFAKRCNAADLKAIKDSDFKAMQASSASFLDLVQQASLNVVLLFANNCGTYVCTTTLCDTCTRKSQIDALVPNG
jgi:hypothetical protein